MLNELRMNLRRLMTLFPEIFHEDPLPHQYRKRAENGQELLSSGDFISDEDQPMYFHIILATTRDVDHGIRVEKQTVSEMSIRETSWTTGIVLCSFGSAARAKPEQD
jgi:hypothetical protein